MYANPFQISIDTLIGTSGILGHRLEERARIREAQDLDIVGFIQNGSTVELRNSEQESLFCVAPLDVLVTENGDRKQFHIIELNGAGIGGLTNISEFAVGCVLNGLMEMARDMPIETPLVVIASSGLESEQMPRRNKTIYEKILYAEAMKRGFQCRGLRSVVSTVTAMRDAPWEMNNGKPTILVGYMKEFLRFLHLNDNGRLILFGRPVSAAVNDRFCLNLVHEFGDKLDLCKLHTMNRCFVPGADKAVAYALLNEYLQQFPTNMTRETHYTLAESREQLIETVLNWVRNGRKAVIKPQGTGLGHGIEFFLAADEIEDQIVGRIDASLQLTERFYGLHGGALPYTICEFLDTAVIRHEGHPMKGHKYELRVVVYRDGGSLKAFPSIVKVSSQVYNSDQPSHLSLINNITASAVATQTAGIEHMLPLSRQDTLDLLDLKPEDLRDVSALATGVVRYVLDQVQDQPVKVGLPHMFGDAEMVQ